MVPLMKKTSFGKKLESYEPKSEEISKLAYELYLERGGDHGKDQEDWLRAEMILREKRSR